MFRSLKSAPAAALILALAAACNTSVNTTKTPDRPSENFIPTEKIIMNPSLHADLRIERVREAMSGNLWRIQVDLTNTTGSDQEFQYRFEWFDAQGFLVDTPASTWLPRSIKAGETLAFNGVAPGPNVADFRFKITTIDR